MCCFLCCCCCCRGRGSFKVTLVYSLFLCTKMFWTHLKKFSWAIESISSSIKIAQRIHLSLADCKNHMLENLAPRYTYFILNTYISFQQMYFLILLLFKTKRSVKEHLQHFKIVRDNYGSTDMRADFCLLNFFNAYFRVQVESRSKDYWILLRKMCWKSQLL